MYISGDEGTNIGRPHILSCAQSLKVQVRHALTYVSWEERESVRTGGLYGNRVSEHDICPFNIQPERRGSYFETIS